VNPEILHRLHEAGGAFVAARDLGDDPDLVRASLDEMERFGFLLERHPYLGVAWRGPAARLCPDQIEWELGTRRIGRRIAVWNRVASTNDLAAAASGSMANEGLVVLAEEQTAGRGRRGRSWVAPSGASLLMSVLIFPDGVLATPSWLTALGAVAVADVLAEVSGRDARIKWPNDVRVDGRKIAGVLVERGAGAVIGIGLNVNFVEDDLPDSLRETAVSLRMLSGRIEDRSELARRLIRRLDVLFEEGMSAGASPLARSWRDRLEPLGRQVVLSTRSGEVSGRLVEADLVRGLCLTLPDGSSPWFDHAAILGIDGEMLAISS
jgi:BirA family biotin operon repressor/biotin-[acetyl-CoA-carboxylase] ligase